MRFWVFIFLFSLAFSARASVVITEIMYDLEEGGDTGREWVEIQNSGSGIDLTGWKFFENGVNHGLVLAQGSVSLPQNGFAIIADNAEKFFLDWPGFSGILFDSSFSLSNSGETLILRDAGLADIDTATYSLELGANGDGNSLQKVNIDWVSSTPTPGELNTEEVVEEKVSPPLEGGASTIIEGGGNGNNGSVPPPPKSSFSAFAGEDKSALAGAEVYFEGQVSGISENLVNTVRFFWNFGDGTVGDGNKIKHLFQYPGVYIVNLNVSLGANSASDFAKVVVSPAGIIFSEIKPGNFLEIKNDSTKISDVSGFGIQINNSKIFNFPKDTKLSASSFLTLDSSTLGFEIPDAGEIKILYPNNKVLVSSKYGPVVLRESESIGFDGGIWKKSEATPGAKNQIKKDVVQEKTTLPPTPPPLTVRGLGQGGGVIEVGGGEASVINSQTGASFWSEIKWLIFGLGGGILGGLVYVFLKKRLTANVNNIQ